MLRNVRWLTSDVVDTFRDQGAQVDDQGFVLDRKGGRYQGTDRYYLGRAAVERRKQELKGALSELHAEHKDLDARLAALREQERQLARHIDEERTRQDWLGKAERHGFLQQSLQTLEQQIGDQRGLVDALDKERDDIQDRRTALHKELGAQETEYRNQRGQREQTSQALNELDGKLRQAQRDLADAEAELPGERDEDAFEYSAKGVAFLKQAVEIADQNLANFDERDRDPKSPRQRHHPGAPGQCRARRTRATG